MNRLPFDDLHREAGLENFTLLSVRLGLSSRTLHRWKNNGVPLRDADDVAIRLGSHPDYIWPNQWHTLAERQAS